MRYNKQKETALEAVYTEGERRHQEKAHSTEKTVQQLIVLLFSSYNTGTDSDASFAKHPTRLAN